ncbi:MAG: YARHG domain-containing protein, partial [Bacteroides sp.]|nr:YARHG domain-containing protein [Bacteroides sp.]
LTRHFSQYSWYHPEGDMSYALTSLERKNVEIIKSYE